MSARRASRSAARVLRMLRAGPAALERVGKGRVRLEVPRIGVIEVEEATLRALAGHGAIVLDAARANLPAGSPGASAATGRPGRNPDESPLAQLARLKVKDGSAFLSPREVDAGEKLRVDFTRGRLTPRLGVDWDRFGGGDRAGAAAELTETALAARWRLEAALAAVGPELSGLLLDVCCFLKGMEAVESERGWPARSAKVVLKTGLAALARHYWPDRPDGRAGILHWGAEDFRPILTAPRPPVE